MGSSPTGPTIRLRELISSLRSWSLTAKRAKTNALSEAELVEAESKGLRMEMRYVVYILICRDQSYYVGSTSDMTRRFQDHQQGIAASWTAKRLPVTLVYTETYSNLSSARRREKQLKGWSREKKQKLISGEWSQPNSAGIV